MFVKIFFVYRYYLQEKCSLTRGWKDIISFQYSEGNLYIWKKWGGTSEFVLRVSVLSADCRSKLCGLHRLGDIIIHAGFETLFPVSQ